MSPPNIFPIGSIEPHQYLLKRPTDNQTLYKILSVENLIKSISNNYLHFPKVNTYKDSPWSDESDGEQLPLDRPANQNSILLGDRTYNAAKNYDECRAKTYVYCLSIENSDHIWKECGNDPETKGKACIVFNFGQLRQTLNQTFPNWRPKLAKEECLNIFSINYGLVEYVNKQEYRLNEKHLATPIQYAYVKDEKYSPEKELRISLSNSVLCKGFLIGQEIIEVKNFPPFLQFYFDFKTGIKSGMVKILFNDPAVDLYYRQEMKKLNFLIK